MATRKYVVNLAFCVHAYVRTSVPLFLAVPEFHAIDHAPFTGKVNRAALSARPDARPNRKFLLRAILEMDDHALKLNRAAVYAQLYLMEGPLGTAHVDCVVIDSSINMGRAQYDPILAMRGRRHQGEDKKRANDPMEMLFQHALPPLIGNSEAGNAKRNCERQTCESAGVDAHVTDGLLVGCSSRCKRMLRSRHRVASGNLRDHRARPEI